MSGAIRTEKRIAILELGIFSVICLSSVAPFGLPFSNTVLMLLFACYSIWVRDLRLKSVGLESPPYWWKAILYGAFGTLIIVPAFIWMILPAATWIAGHAIDFSVLESLRGNLPLLLQNLVLVWIFAAFAEEVIFRGYLLNRIANLIGETPVAYLVALILSSVIFGAAHSYQGLTGIINSGAIGFLLGGIYLLTKRNLWTVIICHGLVDTTFMVLLYLKLDIGLFK